MSIIYKIFCKDENIKECYIGSTNNLHIRKIKHKYSCNNNNSNRYHLKLYKFIRANSGWDNFDFIILEQYENKMTKKDLLKIEGQYIKNLKPTLNCVIVGRTKQQWDEDNKMYMIEYYKKYNEDNKQYSKEYNKKYYEQNKKQIAEKKKANYENNKEKLTEKVECIYCKALITKYSLRVHQSRKKCLSFQNTNQI